MAIGTFTIGVLLMILGVLLFLIDVRSLLIMLAWWFWLTL